MPVEAVKMAEEALAGTVTETGTLSVALLAESATTAPAAGATLERVTVQVVLAFAESLVAVHWSDERVTRVTGAVRERVAVLETPARSTITVAF